jgi:MFS family permease
VFPDLDRQAKSLPENNRKSKLYYGYILVAICFFIMLIVFGSQMSFGVFFKPMLADFGWTRAATSGPFSLSLVILGVFGFISGQLSDRFNPKIIISIGAVILGTGYILTSRITSLWQFYLFYGVLTAIGTGSVYIPLVSMIARWFGKRRGLMAGIAISGIGLGVAVMPPIASQLIISFNWRDSLLILGVVNVVALLITAQFLKSKPEDIGAPDVNRNSHQLSSDKVKEFSFKEVIKTQPFWIFFVTWMVYGFFFHVGSVHTVPYATDLGMTATAAAGVMTIIGILGTIGRVGLGFGGDRFGNKTMIFTSLVLLGLGYLGMVVSDSRATLYTFAVAYGCTSGFGILLAPLSAEYFGMESLGAITGAIAFANSVGAAIGPTMAGFIYDTTGSYRLAFLICAFLALVASVLFWVLKPAKHV